MTRRSISSATKSRICSQGSKIGGTSRPAAIALPTPSSKVILKHLHRYARLLPQSMSPEPRPLQIYGAKDFLGRGPRWVAQIARARPIAGAGRPCLHRVRLLTWLDLNKMDAWRSPSPRHTWPRDITVAARRLAKGRALLDEAPMNPARINNEHEYFRREYRREGKRAAFRGG